MPKYKIEWTEESWYRTTIEAGSEQEAMDLWASGYHLRNEILEPYDIYTQEGVDITELED